MLTFVSAGPKDIDVIFQLNKALIEEYEDIASIDYDRVIQWVRKNIENNITFFTKVMEDGQPAGYFSLTPGPEKAELDSLFVLPKSRCRGIGTAVLKKCLRETKTPVCLYVFQRNTAAIRLYQRMGFVITQEVGATRYIMEAKRQDC